MRNWQRMRTAISGNSALSLANSFAAERQGLCILVEGHGVAVTQHSQSRIQR